MALRTYRTQTGELRAIYPARCLSASCGMSGVECNESCPGYQAYTEFQSWVNEHAAVIADPSWAPNVYVATK